MTKRVVLNGTVAARLAAHTGDANHSKFDLSRILYSPSLNAFLSTNSYTMLVVEPLPEVTATPWTPSPHAPCTKEVWITSSDMVRAAEVAKDVGGQMELVDTGEKSGFWCNNRLVALDNAPSEKAFPPISMRFFPKESAPIATLFGAREMVSIAESLQAVADACADPSKTPPITLGVHGNGWSKDVIEFSIPGPQSTVCRAVIMPMSVQESPDYAALYSGKPPAMNDAALKLLDWRSATAQTVDPKSEELVIAIGLLMQMQLTGDKIEPKGLDADQLSAMRNLLCHVVSAIKVIRTGG